MIQAERKSQPQQKTTAPTGELFKETTTMSSRQLIDVLKSIGCPEAGRLTPESIDWMFENESVQPFLSWLCNSITEENVITDEDATMYKSLETFGNILEGQELEEAMASASITPSETLTPAQLQSSVEELKVANEKCKARKNLLLKRCNKMRMQHMELKNQVSKMEDVEVHWAREKQQAVDKCRLGNTHQYEALQQLSRQVAEMVNLYASPDVKSKKSNNSNPEDRQHFLSQVELDAFNEAEAKFSKELTAFTKKQFFTGMADLAGEREETEYYLLDISSPGAVKEEDVEEQNIWDGCQEFSRLQEIFPKSECARINALINAKKAVSAVHEARAILHKLKYGMFPTVPKELSSLRHIAEKAAAAAKAESTPVLSSVEELIKELGGLQGTEVLTGDYDLKLKRQDYFMKSQDKITQHLVEQRARSEFLGMLYDLELKWHQETHSLLSAARDTLDKELQDWQERMSALDEPDFSEKKFDRNVVDTRDTSTARLYQLTDTCLDDEKQLYLPTDKVTKAIKKLKADHKTAVVNGRNRDNYDLDKIKQLGLCVNECESVLYSQSSTRSGQPSMTPVQVQSAMTQLSTQLTGLKTKVADMVAQVNSKRTDLRNNILQKKERQLFILFHTNPEKLKYVVNGLAERGKAQKIQED